MVAINSLQVMARPVSARTLAVAASALSFGWPPAGARSAAFGFRGVLLDLADAVLAAFFFVADIGSPLVRNSREPRPPRLPRCPFPGSAQLPRRRHRFKALSKRILPCRAWLARLGTAAGTITQSHRYALSSIRPPKTASRRCPRAVQP